MIAIECLGKGLIIHPPNAKNIYFFKIMQYVKTEIL